MFISVEPEIGQGSCAALTRLVEKMSTKPAEILGLECGLRVGRPADITIIDSELSYTVDAADFRSLAAIPLLTAGS